MTTVPVLKRADQLVVGDRIQPGYLPAYSRSGEGVVRYVETYHYRGADWVFAAFATADGDRNSTSYLPAGKLQVIPADTGLDYSRADDDPETTQPIAGRVPAHFGPLVNEGGHTAVAIGGGLIEIDQPEGFVPASAEPDMRAMPNGMERPGEHWNARLIREAREREAR